MIGIRTILKSFRLFDNWLEIGLAHIGFMRRRMLMYRFRDGTVLLTRNVARGGDKAAVKSVWMCRHYLTGDDDIGAGDVVLDLGAHIGVFSVLAATHRQGVRVYAYEPCPENFELLKRNIELNRLNGSIVPIRAAVSAERGETRLFIGDETTAHSVVHQTGPPLTVPSVTLQDILGSHDLDLCDLLKIDIEGAEYSVLKGTPPAVFERVRKICLEYDLEDYPVGGERGTLEDLLVGLGYSIVRRNEVTGSAGTYVYVFAQRR